MTATIKFTPTQRVVFTDGGTAVYADDASGVTAVISFREREGRRVVAKIEAWAERVSSRSLAAIPIGRIETLANATDQAEVPFPATPTGPKYPDGFYADFAKAYTAKAGRSTKAAAEAATVMGVPVTTIHRWVKVARRRGLMAPAGGAR